MRNAHLIALSYHDPKRLSEEIREFSEGETPSGADDIDGILSIAKAHGLNVIVEELVE